MGRIEVVQVGAGVTRSLLVTMANPLAAGAPMMVAQFVEGLRAAGYGVVVAHGPANPPTVADVLGRLRASGATLAEQEPFRGATLWRNARAALELARVHGCVGVLSTQQADRMVAAVVSRRARLPFVSYCGLPTIVHGARIVRRLKARGQGWAFRRADVVICPSPSTQRFVVAQHGVGESRARLLYNGIDTAAYRERAAVARSERVEVAGPIRIATVGRTQWEKGHDLLLRALIDCVGDLPDWSLRIVGARTGGGSDEHDALVTGLAGHPVLAGRVQMPGWSTEVGAELGRTDLYVHPSRTEGWSLAVCEAMAAGTPVILSDCAGRPPGFVDGVHGWIVPTGDVAALGQAIVTAARLDERARAVIGAAASQYASQHFDIGPCTAQVVRWFDELTATDGQG